MVICGTAHRNALKVEQKTLYTRIDAVYRVYPLHSSDDTVGLERLCDEGICSYLQCFLNDTLHA